MIIALDDYYAIINEPTPFIHRIRNYKTITLSFCIIGIISKGSSIVTTSNFDESCADEGNFQYLKVLPLAISLFLLHLY